MPVPKTADLRGSWTGVFHRVYANPHTADKKADTQSCRLGVFFESARRKEAALNPRFSHCGAKRRTNRRSRKFRQYPKAQRRAQAKIRVYSPRSREYLRRNSRKAFSKNGFAYARNKTEFRGFLPKESFRESARGFARRIRAQSRISSRPSFYEHFRRVSDECDRLFLIVEGERNRLVDILRRHLV